MADEKRIEKWDPTSLGDKLKDRIKNSIADLIPEETWKAMMQKEIDAFFNDQTTYDRFNDRHTTRSTFKQVFEQIMTERTKKQIEDYLSRPEMQPVWDSQRHLAGDGVKKLAVELAPQMMETLLASALQNFIIQLRTTIQSSAQNWPR